MENLFWILQNYNNKGTLIWVDDLFFASSTFPRTSDEPEITNHWFESRLSILQLGRQIDGTQDKFGAYLQVIYTICQGLKFNFLVANFSGSKNYLAQNNISNSPLLNLFLIDIENKEIEDQTEGKYYGCQFVIDNLKNFFQEGKVRFYTRFVNRVEEFHDFTITMTTNECISPSYMKNSPETTKIKTWLESFVIHPDPIICEFLKFYSKPWTDQWQHKWHDENDHNNQDDPDELKKFLGNNVDVKLSDSKCLLIWRGNPNRWGEWFLSAENTVQPLREGYPVSGKVLQAVMERLNINVEGIDHNSSYRMPLDAALPFLLCLRLFACQVNPEAPKVIWNRLVNNDNVIYQLAIQCSEKSWGLRNRYYNQGDHQAELSKCLQNLMQCKLEIRGTDEWVTLFNGGVTYPPYGLYFTPGQVHLFWVSRPSSNYKQSFSKELKI